MSPTSSLQKMQKLGSFLTLVGLLGSSFSLFLGNVQTQAQTTESPSLDSNNSASSSSLAANQSSNQNCNLNQFKAEYFPIATKNTINSDWQNNNLFSSSAVLTRCEEKIDYNWEQDQKVDEKLPNNYFAARWSGEFSFERGEYEFSVLGDDDLRLFVDGQKVASATWQNRQDWQKAKLKLDGKHQLKVEYKQGAREAYAKVKWGKTADLEPEKTSPVVDPIVDPGIDPIIDPGIKDPIVDPGIGDSGRLRKQGYLSYIEKDAITPAEEQTIGPDLANEPAPEFGSPTHEDEQSWGFLDKESGKYLAVKNPAALINSKQIADKISGKLVEITVDSSQFTQILNNDGELEITDIVPLENPSINDIALPAVGDPFFGDNATSGPLLGQYRDQIGDKKYAVLFCQYQGNTARGYTKAQMDAMGATLTDYYAKSSYGKLNLTFDTYTNNDNWRMLPRTQPQYIASSFDFFRQINNMAQDCMNLYENDVDFNQYAGVIGIYNGQIIGGNPAIGAPRQTYIVKGQFHTLNSVWIPPWGYNGRSANFTWNESPHVFVHEIGHSFGLPHSGVSTLFGDYLNPWSVMSGGEYRVPLNNSMNLLPSDEIAYYKDRMGWVDEGRRLRWQVGDAPTSIEIEALSDPLQNPGTYQVAYLRASNNLIYALDARFFRDFDRNLTQINNRHARNLNLQEGVVIHDINLFTNTFQNNRNAILNTEAHSDDNFSSLTQGRSFTANGVTVNICQKKEASFVVNINQPCPAMVAGRVFNDLNFNDLQGGGDTPRAGIVATLKNAADNANAGVSGTNSLGGPNFVNPVTTDEHGDYAFLDVLPGTYTVSFENLASDEDFSQMDVNGNGNDTIDSDVNSKNHPTLPSSTNSFQVGANGSTNLDAGIVRIQTIISGLMFMDGGMQNSIECRIGSIDGLHEQGECPYRGWIVILYGEDNNLLATTSTDFAGRYTFSGNYEGNLYVEFQKPGGRSFTLKDVNNNANDDRDSDVNENGRTDIFTTTIGGRVANLNAGAVQNRLDLAVTKTADKAGAPAQYTIGEAVRYSITIQNLSQTENATGVGLIDALPTNLTYQSSTCNYTTVNGSLFFGDINAGESRTCEILVTLTSGNPGDLITNQTRNLFLQELDTNPDNNNSSVQIQIAQAQTDVEIISVTPSINPAKPGQTVQVRVRVRNNGPLATNNVRISVQPGAGLVKPDSFNLISGANNVDGAWVIPLLDINQETEIVYEFVVDDQEGAPLPFDYPIIAIHTGNSVSFPDTNTDNDSARGLITVVTGSKTFAWGSGAFGRGIYTEILNTPTEILSNYNIKQAANDDVAGLALTQEGKVLAWKSHSKCINENPNHIDFLSNTAREFDIPGAIKVAGNESNRYILLENGTVLASGASFEPVTGNIQCLAGDERGLVQLNLSNIKDLSPNGVTFLTNDNRVLVRRNTNFVEIFGPNDNVISISDYSVVKSDGTVWTWGLNNTGQLGNGTVDRDLNQETPVQTIFPSGVQITSVSHSVSHALALDSTGRVWAWGENYHGQLGNNKSAADYQTGDYFAFEPTPALVQGLDNVKAIVSGGIANSETPRWAWGYSVALRNDGTVWTWGSHGTNGSPTLGNGGLDVDSKLPSQALGLANVTQIHTSGGMVTALAGAENTVED